MCVYRLDADAAFELLRSRSMEANVKLRVLAEQLMAEFRTLIPDGAPMPSRSEFERILLTAHERV